MRLWILFVAVFLGATLGLMPDRERDPVSLTAIDVDVAPLPVPVYHSPSVTLGDASNYSPPDFTAYTDAVRRKQAFFDYLLPKVYKSNREIVRERQWLLALRDKVLDGHPLTRRELAELAAFERRYDVDDPAPRVPARLGELLRRVDVVPASLVLAQAAKESGWGTSRFAREANNFFGIWCFYEGCGLKPLQRKEGLSHEVAMFATVEQGVRYYMRTINSHRAYEPLRQVRAEARRDNQLFAGEQLAVGLLRYSERGSAYVEEIQAMIRTNRLHRFTRSVTRSIDSA